MKREFSKVIEHLTNLGKQFETTMKAKEVSNNFAQLFFSLQNNVLLQKQLF